MVCVVNISLSYAGPLISMSGWCQLIIFWLSFIFISANSSPLLKDLHCLITPQYAAHWRVIGLQLGLPSGTLDIIEQDNVYRSVPCCNAMWSKWVKMDPSASWGKLFKAIDGVSSDQVHNKGD